MAFAWSLAGYPLLGDDVVRLGEAGLLRSFPRLLKVDPSLVTHHGLLLEDTPAGDPGIIHGLALWFDLEIHEGSWISNAPRLDAEPWGQWLLPLDPQIEVAAGQGVAASVWRESLADGAPGWLRWSCRAGDQERTGHEFAGTLIGPNDLAGPAGE